MTLCSWNYNLRSKHSWKKLCKESCRFHGIIQLSCWKFPLNHLVSWWKFGSKLWKKVNFQHLEKFLSLEFLTFQNKILTFWFLDEHVSYFDMFWWIVIFDTWFWPKSQSLNFQCTVDFWPVDWKSTINQMTLSNILSHSLGKNDAL